MVVIVQQKNVLNPIVLRANIYAENQETADTPMHHIIAEMVIGHITELVPTTVTHQPESAMKNVLQANTLAPATTQCIVGMDFGKQTSPALTEDAIHQQENANRQNALLVNTNAPITIQCSVKMDFGKTTNPALTDATNQRENVKYATQ